MEQLPARALEGDAVGEPCSVPCGLPEEAACWHCPTSCTKACVGPAANLLLLQPAQTKCLKLTLPGAPAFLELSPKRNCKHNRNSWLYAHVTGCLLSVSRPRMPAQTPTLDFVAPMTQQSGMSQTQQHVEIPSDERIRKHADKPILLHNPVVAD